MKSISNKSFIHQPLSFFKERLVPILSALLEKIKTIAIEAFKLIAGCFVPSKSTPASHQKIRLYQSVFPNSSQNIPGRNGINDEIIQNSNLGSSDNQPNASITEIAIHSVKSYDPDESMRTAITAMINLDVWVNAGNSHERRQVAKDRIFEFLNGSQEVCILSLSKLNLSSLPNIFNISAFHDRLNDLDLSENQLETLPHEIGQLRKLRRLVLRENQLTIFTPEIGQLTQLKELDFRKNRLEILPPKIGQLAELTRLDLSHNQLETLSPEIWQLTKLEKLNLIGNQLTTLPPEIRQLTKLVRLFLSANQLEALPIEIWQLIQLKVLGLGANRLATLPAEIGQLTRLYFIDLMSNQLMTLPPEIGQLTQLRYLELGCNQLTTLPPEIRQLTKLVRLSLGRNQLEALPIEIWQLIQLKTLGLDENRLVTLPGEIGQLTQLHSLHLGHTPLLGLPLEVMNLSQSCTVDIRDCNFTPAVLERIRNQTEAPGYAGPRFRFSMEHTNPEDLQDLTVEALLQNLFHEVNEPYLLMTNILGEDLSQNALRPWLSRLSFMSDYNSSPERKQWLVNKIIQYLKLANESEPFRERLFSIIGGAAETCGDRVALSVLHLGIAYQLATIDRHEVKQLADFLARGVWAMSMFETIARNKVVTLPFFDEIEVYLAYPVMLKERLQLPIDVEGMLFYGMSEVISSDLDEACSFVTAKLADQAAFYDFLVDEPEWKDALKINYPEQYQAIEMEKKEQLDHATHSEEYLQIEKTYRTKLLDLTTRALSEPSQNASSSTD